MWQITWAPCPLPIWVPHPQISLHLPTLVLHLLELFKFIHLGPSSPTCLQCSPYIYWQTGSWPSTEKFSLIDRIARSVFLIGWEKNDLNHYIILAFRIMCVISCRTMSFPRDFTAENAFTVCEVHWWVVNGQSSKYRQPWCISRRNLYTLLHLPFIFYSFCIKKCHYEYSLQLTLGINIAEIWKEFGKILCEIDVFTKSLLSSKPRKPNQAWRKYGYLRNWGTSFNVLHLPLWILHY